MNSEKAAVRRKPEPNNGGCMKASNEDTVSVQQLPEESPNNLLYKKVSYAVELKYPIKDLSEYNIDKPRGY